MFGHAAWQTCVSWNGLGGNGGGLFVSSPQLRPIWNKQPLPQRRTCHGMDLWKDWRNHLSDQSGVWQSHGFIMKASHAGKFLASTKRGPAFISREFTYWKEVTSALEKHQSSDVLGDIGQVLSKKHEKAKAVNTKMFLTTLSEQQISCPSRFGHQKSLWCWQ